MKKIYYSLICVVLLCVSIIVQAQSIETKNPLASLEFVDKTNSPAGFEFMKKKELWRQSSNAAGLLLDNPIEYTELTAGYNLNSGNFHRPQQGEKENNLVFNAEGAVILKKYYVWGKFNYSRDAIKDATYNASIIDPYRDMPYYVADVNPSKWNNQNYNLQFKAATPAFGPVALGIEGTYKASLGSKQRDIRADSRFYTIDVKPGVVYTIDKKNHIGANFNYYNIKEYSEMSNVNVYVDQDYYEMYGLGSARKGLGSGRSTSYIGNGVGGGLQYYHSGAINILFSTNFLKKVEDVQVDGSSPRDDGTVKEQTWINKISLFSKGKKYAHSLNIQYLHKKMDGIEYVTQLNDSTGWESLRSDISSKYNTRRLSADYTLFSNLKQEYDWNAGVEVIYEKKEDEYLLPKSTWGYENLLFGISGKKNFVLSDRLMKRLLIGGSIHYNKNLSGSYSYNGTHPDYIVVTDFQQTDLNYMLCDFYSYGISAVYSQKLNHLSDATVFAKASFKQNRTNDFNFSNRNCIQISLGCNF